MESSQIQLNGPDSLLVSGMARGAIEKTVVFERDARPRKHPFGVLEAQAVLCEVRPVLRFVPFEIISKCSSFCSYAQASVQEPHDPALAVVWVWEALNAFLPRAG